ncbi:amidase [Paracoccus sp. MKU1]|uniref:amidase n=1 Tax=Paracoccus sp. MKU1 TaxID=1745182 RepID=UPI0007193ED8|nr:amidase [Paracoccus sp. MKU1]KRW96831.1 hypothetical protein AQY21_07015 [Paracoccus sp. MKU1]
MYYDSIKDLSTRISSREVSPIDAVEACLRRIATLNPKLNAFITVMDDDAREQARQAEAEIKAGHCRGPLHGIPVAVKDFYDTAGVRTTAGFEHFKDRMPEADAQAVDRLKRSGAIIVGKTNMDSLGMATTGLTSCFGPVRNPWNEAYVPGGSSAGSAVAVAAGLCYATIDTDAVGSTRLPAACCGVIGFKGGFDLISTKGILGDEPVDDFIRWMAHAGITTRSAADTALMLNVLSEREGNISLADLEDPATSLRLGIGNNFKSDGEIRHAFDQAVNILRGVGYGLGEAAVPVWNPQAGLDTIEADRVNVTRDAFADADIILLPTLTSCVPSIEAAANKPDQGVAPENTAFANYYALPAVTVSCGFDSKGMPIGLQIVGKPGGEQNILQVARHYEITASFGSSHPIP